MMCRRASSYWFDDGRFIAKLAQSFRNIDVQGFVVAIDSVTGNYFWNPPVGCMDPRV
jgi:hypothetical protein